MKKLEGKVALVTASSRGIGFASADILAENGAIVYIAVFSEEEGREAIEKINAKGNIAKYVYFNAYDKESCTNMVDEVVKNEGKIDILVNNFGATNVKVDFDVVNGDSDEFINIINNNLRSVYLPCKAAINSLTQNIALQYGRSNIRCNAVLPGMTLTKALKDNMPKEFLDSFLRHVPLNRPAVPEDIAKAVLYYASDDSSYVTGMIHEVAGGFGLGTPQYAEMMDMKKN